MKKGGADRHKPLLSALKKAGFKVENLEQQGKKTVITVTPVIQNAGSVKKPPPKAKAKDD
jgi:hypothetical protein